MSSMLFVFHIFIIGAFLLVVPCFLSSLEQHSNSFGLIFFIALSPSVRAKAKRERRRGQPPVAASRCRCCDVPNVEEARVVFGEKHHMFQGNRSISSVLVVFWGLSDFPARVGGCAGTIDLATIQSVLVSFWQRCASATRSQLCVILSYTCKIL